MLTTKNETSNAWPTRAVKATAITIDRSPSSTGTRPATTAPKTSKRMISAAGSPINNSPFCKSCSESFSKSASAVKEPVIETAKPSWPFSDFTRSTSGATSSVRITSSSIVACRSFEMSDWSFEA